jgi:hypothetical protein
MPQHQKVQAKEMAYLGELPFMMKDENDTTTVNDMESEGVYHLLERDTSTLLGYLPYADVVRKFQRHSNYSILPIAQSNQ